MTGYQKNIPWRSPRYKKWIRNDPCCICGTTEGVHGHHESFGLMGSGMGTKYPDFHCLPMCDGECHRQRTGWKGKWYNFYLSHNVNPVRVMCDCVNRYLQERGVT